MLALLVEDDVRLAAVVKKSLQAAGFDVDVVTTGSEALARLEGGRHNIVILDLRIPPPDGLDVTRTLRRRGDRRPILMLTGSSQLSDKIRGLDAGADDYLTKPFEIGELLARIRALLRRSGAAVTDQIVVGDLVLDPASRTASRSGQAIELTPREFDLLALLMRDAGIVIPRRRILNEVWSIDYEGGPRVIDVYVRYLRAKIDEPFGRHSIETVRGVGYRLLAEPQTSV